MSVCFVSLASTRRAHKCHFSGRIGEPQTVEAALEKMEVERIPNGAEAGGGGMWRGQWRGPRGAE